MTKQANFTKYIKWLALPVLVFGLLKLTTLVDFSRLLEPNTQTLKYLTIIGAIIMVHLVLVAHELGHLIVGLVQGFRFELFVVGLLGIKREEGKVKVYLNKNLGYYGGVAGTSPIDDSPENPKKFARMLLAGPIASILFALFCLLVAILIAPPLALIAYTGALTSVAIFFATTIPNQTGLFFTDRKRYQRLVTPGKDQEVEIAMLQIMGKFAKDNGYKNVEQKEIEILISDDTPFINYFGWFNRMCWELERQGVIEAEVQKQYKTASKQVSQSLVKAFDKEIEKYAAKLKMKQQ